jgi:quinol monooxygenase YgiN
MAPHVTYFKMRAKPGEREKVIKHFNTWLTDRRPEAGGFIRVVLSSNVSDPDEFMAYAMFADKATYDANSSDPGQRAWYEELRSYLDGEPEWFDGKCELQRMGQV